MATLSELIDGRAAAGARYAAAVTELKAAVIELASIERVLANGNIGFPDHPVRTFGALPDPLSLRHPIYVPALGGFWPTEVATAAEQIIRNFTPGEPVGE